MLHALAAIEAAVFLSGPRLLISPRLKIGLGTICEEYPPRAIQERPLTAAKLYSIRGYRR
jgi:hypothetical protein